jgi:hypothetical protein
VLSSWPAFSPGFAEVNSLDHDPGHAQVDFGEALAEIAGVERKIHFFAMDLPQSDACLVQAYPAETAEAFCDGHNAAFAATLQHCNTATLQHCNTATLQHCNTATLQHCNTATPDHARRSPGSGSSFTISGIGSPRTSAPADLCGFPDRLDTFGEDLGQRFADC